MDHLKPAHSADLEQLRRQTPPGMAHWSGTGPGTMRCRSCAHVRLNGSYMKRGKPTEKLKPVQCGKYQQLMRVERSPEFDAMVLACKYFETAP